MDKERAGKMAKLRFLVISVTILILIAWGFNLRNELKIANEIIDKNAAQEAADLKDEMNKTIDEMGEKFGDLTNDSDDGSAPGFEPGSELEVPTDPITGIPEAPNFCPEYVNCMPTIGEARPCVIPPGCEEKTLIVY